MSDLGALIPSTIGKLELESLSDEVPEERVVDRLLARAIHDVFGRRVEIDSLAEVVEAFESGLVIRDRRVGAVARLCPLDARDARHARSGRQAGCRGVARGGRIRGRVPARGPAPPPAAEQGPGGDRRALPGLTGMAAPLDPLDPTGAQAPGRPPIDWSTYADEGYRYARWDGSQRLPDIHADEVLDALSDDLLEDGDIEEALMRLLRRGMPRLEGSLTDALPGLDALRRRLAQERKAALSRYRLDDILADIREELAAIVAAERRGIERRMAGGSDDRGRDPALERLAADLAARRQASLDALPADVGERIRALGEYDFLEPEARDRYRALVERLQGQVLDAAFEGMSDAIAGATPEQLAANREMVRDLDRLLSRRLAGDEPSQDEVDDFLARHGAFFPGARTLDDVVAQLAERMAAMQSLMRSLSPDQRAELDSMMDALLRDDRLRWDLAQLASTLDQLLPGGLGDRSGSGARSRWVSTGPWRSWRASAGWIASRSSSPGWTTRAVWMPSTTQELRDLLGSEAADDLAALRDMSRRLEDAGYIERDEGRLDAHAARRPSARPAGA